jgi:general secretion pathway protein G
VRRPTTQPRPANWAADRYPDRVPKHHWSRESRCLDPGARSKSYVVRLSADGEPGGEHDSPDLYA